MGYFVFIRRFDHRMRVTTAVHSHPDAGQECIYDETAAVYPIPP
jgi:hypothetical protein